MPVIRSSQAASPLLWIGKEMWVFLLPPWLGELLGRASGWWTQALTARGKLFPKGVRTSFSHGDHPDLSLAESQRKSEYQVFPRTNPPDVWWRGCCYNKSQIIQFLLRKPAALSKPRIGLSRESSCSIFCQDRQSSVMGVTGGEVGDSREGAVRGSWGSWASWACRMVVWKSYGRISRIIGSPEP